MRTLVLSQINHLGEEALSLKKKTKIILISIACALVVLGVVGYNVGMNYLSDRAMEVLIADQLESMLESGEITFEEIEEVASGEVKTEKIKTEEIKGEELVPKEEAPKVPEQKPAAEVTPEKKKETISTASKKITDAIPREEKQAMMKLISSRLTKADITYLAGLASGGLEGKEISEAYKVAKERFTPEELQQVRTYWHRYKSMVLKPKPKTEE